MKKHRAFGAFSLVPFLREDMKKHRAFGAFSLVPSWGIAPRELCRSHEQLGDDIFRVRHYAALAITPAAKNSQSVGCFLNAAFDPPFRTKKQMRLIIINRIYFGTPVGGKHEKTPSFRCFFTGTPIEVKNQKTPSIRCFFIGTLMGNRTPDSAVRGRRLNRLTMRAYRVCFVIIA